jgi:hypothetical protein
VRRGETLIMVDDERFPLEAEEKPELVFGGGHVVLPLLRNRS